MAGVPRGAVWLRRAGWFLAALVAAGAALAELGGRLWFADLAAHFRWQCLVLAALAAAIGIGTRRYAMMAVAVAGAAAHGWAMTLPAYAPFSSPSAGTAHFRLVTANLRYDNATPDKILAFVDAAKPDVLVLQEAVSGLHPVIQTLMRRYPHVSPPDWHDSGTLILSRLPLAEARRLGPPDKRGRQSIVYARVPLGSRHLDLYGLHAPVPLRPNAYHRQNELLATLAAAARTGQRTMIVAGDFNMTPWSPRFRALQRDSGLRLASLGGLWRHTWPSATGPWYGHLLLRGLPIDHVLAGAGINVSAVARGPDIGSDHYSVIVDAALGME